MNGSDLSFLDRQAHNVDFHTVQEKLGQVTDFCVPVNPYFPTPEMLSSYARSLEEIMTYYPEEADSLSEILGDYLGVSHEHIVLGNGSTELITAIDHLFIRSPFLTSVPTFGRWTDQITESEKQLVAFQRREDEGFQLNIPRLKETIRREGVRALAVSNPNNPTGSISSPEQLSELLNLDLDLIVIDESFIEFATMDRRYSMVSYALEARNVIVLRSLGKSLGAHGIRLGYSISSAETAQRLRRFLPKWNINALAVAVLRDFPNHLKSYEHSRARVMQDRDYLINSLGGIAGLTVYDSFANFIYAKVSEPFRGREIRNRLISEYGLFVRECGNKVGSSSQYLRIAVNPREATDALATAMSEVLR